MTRLTAILTVFTLSAAAYAGDPPATNKTPVTDTYHGTKVTEDYRWLENWDDAQVKTWSAAQNTYARSILDKLPNVEAIGRRVEQIMTAETVSYYGLTYRGGLLFAITHQPPKQQPFLIVLKSPDDTKTERVLFDPNTLDPSGGTSIDWYVPSPDGSQATGLPW